MADATESARREPIQVMLVEDNAADAELVERLLAPCRNPSFELSRVSNLQAALARAQSGACEVVLLDLSLPDSLGLASLRELALAVPRLPIVVWTGLDEEALAVEAMRHGAQDYLIKGRHDGTLLGLSLRCAIERKTFDAHLADLAYYDQLTGLVNRTLFNDRLSHALARAKRAGRRVALMFLDLDEFKAINDSRGHEAGDSVLQAVAEQLRGAVRQTETVSRFGGDEFSILIEPFDDVTTARTVAERILGRLQQPVSLSGEEIRVSSSIGIALFPDHASDEKTLLRHADAAMFRAKCLGRNNFQFYSKP
jgi:two-component system, cell cycle response regulator